MTDIVTFILSIFFLARGALRGFMNSLMIPFSIIVATIISIIYFQFTKDIIVSLIIGLIGPILLHLLLKFLLKMFAKATNTEIRPGFFSRMGGALLTLAWGWVFIVFALVLLAALPTWGNTLTAMHNDVTKSASYFFARPIGELLFNAPKQNTPSNSTENPNADAKSLAQDPRFLNTLQDPEVQKDIDTHNIVKLMSNPKIIALTQEIMSDPETMKKVLAVYTNQEHPQTTSTGTAAYGIAADLTSYPGQGNKN